MYSLNHRLRGKGRIQRLRDLGPIYKRLHRISSRAKGSELRPRSRAELSVSTREAIEDGLSEGQIAPCVTTLKSQASTTRKERSKMATPIRPNRPIRAMKMTKIVPVRPVSLMTQWSQPGSDSMCAEQTCTKRQDSICNCSRQRHETVDKSVIIGGRRVDLRPMEELQK